MAAQYTVAVVSGRAKGKSLKRGAARPDARSADFGIIRFGHESTARVFVFTIRGAQRSTHR